MLFVYPAIFHKENSDYWVEFPDLPGCHTYGSDIKEAIESSKDALSGYLLTLLENRMKIPAASEISTIHTNDGFTTLIYCDLDQYKSTKAVKKTLSIPKWLNDRATSMRINFSQVLQEALIAKTMK